MIAHGNPKELLRGSPEAKVREFLSRGAAQPDGPSPQGTGK